MDIDSLRDEFESSAEWRLRRKFLESNADSLSIDRLVCLSRCFVNVAVYGCSYPSAVMSEIQERSGGILEEVRAKKKLEAKQKYSTSFVKATGSAGATSTVNYGTTGKTKNEKKFISFVKASDSGDASAAAMHFEETTSTKSSKADNTEHCQQTPSELETSKVEGGIVNTQHAESMPSSVTLLCSEDFWDRGGKSFDSLKDRSKTTAPALVATTSTTALKAPETKPAMTKIDYLLAAENEKDPVLQKVRKFAFEILNLKTPGENAKVTLNAASKRVPISLEFTTKKISGKVGRELFRCWVVLDDDVIIGSGDDKNIKGAKTNAGEVALQNILMPHLRINALNKMLQGSPHPFQTFFLRAAQGDLQKPSTQVPPQSSGVSPPPKTFTSGTSQTTANVESNRHSTNLKRKPNDFKSLDDFIIVEVADMKHSPSQVLRQSADFNRILLEYEFVPHETATRCIVRLENQVMADVVLESKVLAKNTASARCLESLKTSCWILNIKSTEDTDFSSSVSRDFVLSEIKERSDQKIGCDNIGNKMLRKMGWEGGGVGRDGSGIVEPVSLNTVFNREGLGMSSATGSPAELRKHVRELLKNYTKSGSQEELMFSSEFSIEERKIIHEESRRLNLVSKSRGSGDCRYLCVSHKRSAGQLFNHILSQGGETARYKLLPPGSNLQCDLDGTSSQSV